MLHSDVLRLISLYLNPCKLSVCKELHDFYNDSWYFDKLTRIYPNLQSTNYKNLYKKYLKQGDIYVNYELKSEKLLSQGIKVASQEVGELVLTFDGHLFIETDGQKILIDNNVIDIDHNTYIKEYEWYFIDDGEKYKLDITPKNSFTKVLLGDEIFCSLTYDGIYYAGNSKDQIKFFPINDCIDIYLDFDLFVLDSQGTNYHLTMYNDELKYHYDLSEYRLVLHGSVYNYENELIIYRRGKFQKLDIITVSNIYLPNKIDKYLYVSEGMEVIKENNKLHIYTSSEYYLKLNRETVIEEIKDIFGGSYKWYYIK